MRYTVAIIGRPNVGKSTLFNRLCGRRSAIVHDQPGVTRDRKQAPGEIAGIEFSLIDTAGLEEASDETLEGRMMAQTRAAIAQADVLLLLLDGRSGLIPQDTSFAHEIRKSQKPVRVLINKSEGGAGRDTLAEAYKLGLGNPISISAEHGDGITLLADALQEEFERLDTSKKNNATKETKPEGESALSTSHRAGQEAEAGDEHENPTLQITIIGQPNAGKSTLLNALIEEDRVLTGPEAGITRDAIAVDYTYKGRPLKLIDTAGMRRKAKVQDSLEKLSVGDSLHAIKYAHVIILMMDATVPFEKQDLTLAALIEREGRAMVLAINKWDQVTEKKIFVDALKRELDKLLPDVKGIEVVTLSAKNKVGMETLMDKSFEVQQRWNKRIPTAGLNRWLEGALEQHSPPLVQGRRLKLKYMTQAKTRPPTFILFASKKEKLPASYQRYLINGLRQAFDLPGVPIRLLMRQGNNPYVKDKK